MKRTCTYDHYYLYEEIAEKLKDYAARFPRYCKLDVIGVTPEGRDILLLEITDTETGDFSEKPAYYAEGNIHAGEVTGCMAVMGFMDTIFTNIEEEEVKQMLKRYTIYLLPRMSPDGSEYYLTTPDTVRSIPRMYPYNELQPGLQPKDMDGDGQIRAMRVKTPYGIWKISDADPRLMVRRKPDETDGEFYNVYQEGEVLDYDGLNIRMAKQKFAYDNNRSYPFAWAPEWVQGGGGETPLVNPETQANAKFLMAHRNIASVLDMHTFGGMVLYTPGHKSEKDADPEDMAVYHALAEMSAEESGFKVMNVFDGLTPLPGDATYGGFDDFCHYCLGIPAITIECWDPEQRAGLPMKYPVLNEPTEKERTEREQKILKWMDENLTESEGFMPWTHFDHPQLGDVEIGGFNIKFVLQNPPVKFLEEEIDKHIRYMFRAVRALPRLSFDKAEAVKLADGLYQVKAVIGNRGFMSSYSFKEGLKSPQVPEITVTLSGAESFTEGKEKTKIGHLGGYGNTDYMSWNFPATTIETVPTCKEVRYIVKAQAGSKLTLTAEGGHCGKITEEITLM